MQNCQECAGLGAGPGTLMCMTFTEVYDEEKTPRGSSQFMTVLTRK